MFANELNKKLQRLEQQNLMRELLQIQGRNSNEYFIAGKTLLNFCNNDYLGLAQNQTLINKHIEYSKLYGLGSGSSSLVSGYYEIQQELEDKFAEFLGQQQALLFNSGYHANIGVLATLINRSDIVFSDKLCHASLLDGIQLSRAKHYRYQHNNLEHLVQLAKQVEPNFIVTESVFSMEGDIAPINALANFKNSNLIIDDAHGIGVLGKAGAGSADYLAENLCCLISPLGKAFASMGSIVSGSKVVIDTLRQYSRSYKYTTALPPALVATLVSTLKIIRQQHWRRKKLFENIHYFLAMASMLDLELLNKAETPIKLILIKDNSKLMQIQQQLKSQGFLVGAIREPTVPKNTARLRISLNCLHTKPQIKTLVNLVRKYVTEAKDY